MELRVSSTDVNSFARVEFGPMLLTGTVFSAEHQSVNLILGYRLTTRMGHTNAADDTDVVAMGTERPFVASQETVVKESFISGTFNLTQENLARACAVKRVGAHLSIQEKNEKDFSRILKRYLV